MKTDFTAKVISVRGEDLLWTVKERSTDIFRLDLKVSYEFVSKARPGMYCAFEPVSCREHTQRRPFSIVEAEKDRVRFIIKDVGPNTHYFTNLLPGSTINITEPRGREIVLNEEEKNFILVGGGIGAPALIFIASKLRLLGKNVTVFLGGKNYTQIVGEKYFSNFGCKVETIVEEGAFITGKVTDILQRGLASGAGAEVIACGPIPMLKAVYDVCAEHSLPCQVIIESVFACNMGACMGCAVFLQDGDTRHICKDGPAFYSHELDWDKLMAPYSAPRPRKRIAKCDMSITLVGQAGRRLELEYPTIGASGCQSESSLMQGHLDIRYLGAINAKGLSLYPSTGNQPPRVCETPSGMLNAIGLENVGLEAFLEEQLPRLLSFGKPVIVNIHGKTVQEYVEIVQELENTDISAIELNISCPNVKEGMFFGISADLTRELVSFARKATSKFLIVKLTPNVTDHIPIALAAEKAGADAISLINTLMGMAIDIDTRRPKLRNIFGGLSGPAIHPVALRMVYQLCGAGLKIPIIGVGGVNDMSSALDFFIGGAKAIQAGTASFTQGGIFTDIVLGMESYMKENGFAGINELSGSLIID